MIESPPGPDRIWTIGHGDRDFDAVASLLRHHGVQTIADVRSRPYSKHAPEFTKDALGEAAAAAGFGYRWLGDKLGGLPPLDADKLEAGLDELDGLCAASHVALLCAEIDPRRCHRDAVLAPALALRGYHVVHILGDGTAEPHQDHLGLEA